MKRVLLQPEEPASLASLQGGGCSWGQQVGWLGNHGWVGGGGESSCQREALQLPLTLLLQHLAHQGLLLLEEDERRAALRDEQRKGADGGLCGGWQCWESVNAEQKRQTVTRGQCWTQCYSCSPVCICRSCSSCWEWQRGQRASLCSNWLLKTMKTVPWSHCVFVIFDGVLHLLLNDLRCYSLSCLSHLAFITLELHAFRPCRGEPHKGFSFELHSRISRKCQFLFKFGDICIKQSYFEQSRCHNWAALLCQVSWHPHLLWVL